MISKSDWQAVYDELTEADRHRLGEPPTVDELMAYSRGELSPKDAERVSELLGLYPDLAHALAAPFPEEDAKPSEIGYVSPAQISANWNALQPRLEKPRPPRTYNGWRTSFAIAATVAIVCGALLWRAESRLRAPRVITDDYLLTPGAARGGAESSMVVAAKGESLLLIVSLFGAQPAQSYRIEIVDDHAKQVWKSDPLPPPVNESFNVILPRTFLRPGRYDVVLRGAGEKELATYPLRVPSR
ncbi:MAG TPA: hypothetical protein VF824_00570 [Thermoanaerobaculia bacterium]|jgi:hypothetical protein